MQVKEKVDLLVIDPQFDFCDPSGKLYVKGAETDIDRLANMVDRAGDGINDIHVTLDSHQRLHVAHPEFTVDMKGKHPDPYISITSAQVEAGEYRAANDALQGMFLGYLKALEANGRYPYVVWPPHCLIGSPGAAVMPKLMAALDRWVLKNFAVIDWVPKGSSWQTEHYSGVQADVPDPADPTTLLNKRLITTLESCDRLLIAGEASSHCVANTAADVIEAFGDPAYASKITLITDCMSAVGGYEFLWDGFVAKYGQRVNFATAAEAIKSLI